MRPVHSLPTLVLRPRLAMAWQAIICTTGLLIAAPVMAVADSARFDIDVQPLSAALKAFAAQAHMQLLYAYSAVAGTTGNSVVGELEKHAALEQLLRNTGLEVVYSSENAATIRRARQSTEVDPASESVSKPHAEAHGYGGLRLARVAEGTSTDAGIANEPKVQSAQKSSEKKPDQLEEVVVTATKRPVSLQRLPEAVTAITSDRLDELNAQTFEDYFRDVPGLMVLNQGEGRKDFSLRGVSSGQINTNPSTVDISTVSQYYDEIPITASGFQMDPRLIDVDRVEVLRGPQGTFYGEGALGGTIRIITRKPVLDSLTGSLEGRISDTKHGGTNTSESAMINLPILAGKAALRLNGFYADDSGYVDAVNENDAGQITGINKRGINSAYSSGYRGVLLVNPTDRFSILGQAAHFESHTNDFGTYQPLVGDLQVAVCPPPAPAVPPPGGSGGDGAPVMGGGGSMCPGAPFTGGTNTGNLYNLTLSGDLGWATLVSSSSYAKTGTEITQITAHTSGPTLSEPELFQNLSGFTEELRLVSSKSWSDRWDYVLGSYYQDSDTSYDFPQTSTSSGSHRNDFNAKQTALFADAGYALTERLQVRIGFRESYVRNTGDIVIVAPDLSQSRLHNTSSFTPATGRAVLNYFLNNDVMVYTSVARGFRNGTINDTTINYSSLASLPGFTPIPATSQPDTTTNYELGWKLSFPSRKATLNGAIYHTDWQNMQVLSYATSSDTSGPGSLPPGIAPAFVNAPRAAIDGLELEGGLELLTGLQARASWSLIDARLTKDFLLNLLNQGSGDGQLHAKKGDKIPFVASSSGSLSLSYRHSLPGTFAGFAIVNAQYQGPRTTDFNKILDSPPPVGTSSVPIPTYYEMKSYWTTGLQIGLENSRWRAALYVDNLADARADLFNRGNAVQITVRPRTVGLSLRRKFD